MGYVDVHCHLDWKDFKGREDEVVRSARDAGLTMIIANGTGAESNRAVVDLAGRFDIVRPALGIYPPYEAAIEEKDLEEEVAYIRRSGPIAIGEIGLDGTYGTYPEGQEHVFRRMIELGSDLDVPLIIHSRKAEKHTLDILEEMGAGKVVMHCFSGGKKLVKRCLDLGYFFSIPASVVRSEHFQMVAEMAPVNRLLGETDAPFLSPYGRDGLNQPAYVVESYKAIAKVKGLELEEVEKLLWINVSRLFGE
jgi:TatD DNase family protein